ncbi:fasciclin-like arabinogalactan protein 14 [Dendrobium catenatum]|uniref:Fasciclin-like arabinogalactan protein 14 n=1 Tax=Dendrobium catenatum TaxID=906689 RepID=A0A2I0V963_9ASPA|nr:fasciclin-like arabinogalactan protein 14 [Dendrobium catenatum]PKU59953.1 Fasciclin-like arabinogalactan protein 14 [Dendrobium catenatum]
MAIKSLLLLLTITLLFSSSSAHNITRILSKHPKFSIFNSLLSSTNLAKKINHRHSITVLAVSNDSIGGLIGLSPNIQRRILSVHVILDYFDREKLQNLKSHSTIVPTLFQTSGIAKGRTGFLNITKLANGQIAFSSAASGAHHVAKLVGQIAA